MNNEKQSRSELGLTNPAVIDALKVAFDMCFCCKRSIEPGQCVLMASEGEEIICPLHRVFDTYKRAIR